MSEEPVRAGVIGVGSMGRHHARVYRELPEARLVGVSDADHDRVLEAVDIVSVAVPTPYHAEVARAAIDRGVHVLVEKPFVTQPAEGRDLIERADKRGVVLQVGHIERFNPAVRALADIVPDLDLIAVNTDRLGPPLDRTIDDSVVLDLMIHDIDILLSLIDSGIEQVNASGTRGDQYLCAVLTFANGVVADLTASRVTQEKVRTLSLTAENCRINLDYGEQSVEIHRHSLPEYIVTNDNVRYRHESIIEHPTVESGEPLKLELSSFVEASRTGSRPVVDGEAGLRAIAVAHDIIDAADRPIAGVQHA
jgi:predicted dehydrogenase